MKNKILLLFLIFLTSCTESVDLIVHNAKIYSADELNNTYSSFAVKEGKFVYVGGDEILSNYSSSNIINAQELPVYPGFIDSHAHFYDLGFYLNQVDLKNTQSLEEVIDRVTEFDAENNSDFIIGRGWDQNDWNNKTFPTNTLLNEKFPDKPVVLRRIDGHAYLVNDSALKLAGINNLTKVEGGEIVKIGNRLTGVLIDNSMRLVDNIIPEPSREESIQALLSAMTSTTYVVSLTVYNTCGDSDTYSSVLGDALGEDEYTLFNVKVFPNPAKGFITLESDAGMEGTISLIDALGRTVVEMNANGMSNQVIDVRDLSAGTYVLRVLNNGQLFQERVQIVK